MSNNENGDAIGNGEVEAVNDRGWLQEKFGFKQFKRVKSQIRRITNLWFFFNLFISLIFFALRVTPPLCQYLFDSCEMSMEESQAVLFMLCVSVVKNRRALDWVSYLKTFLLLCKFCSLYLFWSYDVLYGILFGLIVLIYYVCFPEPDYTGPDRVHYMTEQLLEAELEAGSIAKCKRVMLVCFYTPFSQACINVAPLFAQLSEEYGDLPNLKFAKLDVNRFQKCGEKFNIQTKAWMKQLPCFILFENGKQIITRPDYDRQGRLNLFKCTQSNIENAFNLSALHEDCKKSWGKRDKALKKDE